MRAQADTGSPHPQSKRGLASRSRLAACAVPAAATTLCLFALMQSLIGADHPVVTASEPLTIAKITPSKAKSDAPKSARDSALLIETASPPPSLPAATATTADIRLETPGATGRAPDAPPRGALIALDLSAGSIVSRELMPLRPPVPVYPERALRAGLEGVCEVRLDVSPRGKPLNVSADCTNSVFIAAAERAAKKADFAPQIRGGKPTAITGVVYPIVFELAPER